jgi:hypothetical protein
MGGAILFVCTLAATMVVGTFVFAYASHCFFTVVQSTSAGNDEVVWPNEPMYDWLWEAVYMLWLIGLWLGPIVLALRAATPRQSGGGSVQVLLVSAALVWLFFPITLLSSMSAASRWLILSPGLLSRLLGQRFGSLAAFYLHSGPILAGAAALMYLTFFGSSGIWFLLVAAVGLAAALMIYARQLGRLAHLVEHTRGNADPRPETRGSGPKRPQGRRHSTVPSDRPLQPSELPPVMSPSEGPITGYDVRYDDGSIPASPAAPRKRPIDLDDVPYELVGSPNVAPPRGPMPKQWSEPSEYEMALARGGQAPPPPASPWIAGVYNFPLYPRTLPPLVALTAGLAFLGILIHMLIAFNPQ